MIYECRHDTRVESKHDKKFIDLAVNGKGSEASLVLKKGDEYEDIKKFTKRLNVTASCDPLHNKQRVLISYVLLFLVLSPPLYPSIPSSFAPLVCCLLIVFTCFVLVLDLFFALVYKILLNIFLLPSALVYILTHAYM